MFLLLKQDKEKSMVRIKRIIDYLLYDPGKLFGLCALVIMRLPFIRKIIPAELFTMFEYRIYMDKKLNLENPKTFNEKLQWLKLYDKNPLYTQLADKYEVREYVKEKLGEQYLVPLIGIYNSVEQIPFDDLPDQYVLKCTHDSGTAIIKNATNEISVGEIKKKLKKALKRKYYYEHREWCYKNIKPRIMAEKYMSDGEFYDSGKLIKGLTDYKFFCFNGEPKFIYVSKGLEDHKTAYISFYDLDYNLLPFKRSDYKDFTTKPPQPKNFEDMKRISKALSAGCPFLRVDLYEIDGKVYFSELTFSPCAGYLPFDPPEYNLIIGDMLDLTKMNKK
jgi:hypothetical protein